MTAVRTRVDPVTASANDGSVAASSDASGRFLVFQSRASNLVAGDSNKIPADVSGLITPLRSTQESHTVGQSLNGKLSTCVINWMK